MRIGVIGCGRWGTFIASYVCNLGYTTVLYGRSNSRNLKQLTETRKNDLMALPDELILTDQLSLIKNTDIIIISIDAQNLRSLLKELNKNGFVNKTFVLCMKGLEIETGKRLSVVAKEECDPSNKIAVWLGPGHVQEFSKGVPNCMVIDSEDEELKKELVHAFNSDTIRFYYGTDLIGNEIGAATKNVIGIAAGMLDAMNLSSLKGALLARAPYEISKLIKHLGGNQISAYGLCHLGDYEATVFSNYSHNRQFGENWIRKVPYTQLAEGYYTVQALYKLQQETDIELPICNTVYDILFNQADPKEVLNRLFVRSIKPEFKN